eukprot:3991557-Pyramimonas_sp.AAC.1
MASRSRGQAVVGELLGVARRTAQGKSGMATESGAHRLGEVGGSGRAWRSSLCDRAATHTSTSAVGTLGSTSASSFGTGVWQAVRHFHRGVAPSFSRASP